MGDGQGIPASCGSSLTLKSPTGSPEVDWPIGGAAPAVSHWHLLLPRETKKRVVVCLAAKAMYPGYISFLASRPRRPPAALRPQQDPRPRGSSLPYPPGPPAHKREFKCYRGGKGGWWPLSAISAAARRGVP